MGLENFIRSRRWLLCHRKAVLENLSKFTKRLPWRIAKRILPWVLSCEFYKALQACYFLFSLCLSVSLSVSLSASLSFSLFLSLSFFLSLSVSLFLSRSLPPSLSLSLSLSFSLSLSLSPLSPSSLSLSEQVYFSLMTVFSHQNGSFFVTFLTESSIFFILNVFRRVFHNHVYSLNKIEN